MRKKKILNWFDYLGCADTNIIDCPFYHCEHDYWDEYDEYCYFSNCIHKPKTKIICYLPKFIKKILKKILNYFDYKEIKKMYKNKEYDL